MPRKLKVSNAPIQVSGRVRDENGRFISKSTRKESKIIPKGMTGTPFSSVFSNQSFFNRSSKKIGYREVRNMAVSNNIVRIVINSIENSINRTKWVFKPKDLSKRLEFQPEIEFLTHLLTTPDDNEGTFRTLFMKVIEDVLVIDNGVIEKVRNARGEIVQLYHVDGSTIRPRIDEYGLLDDPAYVQYLDPQKAADPSNNKPDAEFSKEDLIIFQASPQGDVGRVGYGMSPVEYIIMTVSTSLQAALFNARYFDDAKLPPYVANLKGVDQDSLIQFKESFENALRGNQWAGAWTNAEDFQMKLFRPTNQEMQFYELNMWLMKIIFGAFEMTPNDFGFTDDVNKATAQVQERIGKSRGVQNILQLIKERIDHSIISDLAKINPKFNEIEFGWDSVDLSEDKQQAEIDHIYLQDGVITPNEVRARDGKEELEGGDVPIGQKNKETNPQEDNVEEDEVDKELDENGKPIEEVKKSSPIKLVLSEQSWESWYR